jgi:hypothetical protein
LVKGGSAIVLNIIAKNGSPQIVILENFRESRENHSSDARNGIKAEKGRYANEFKLDDPLLKK